MPIPRSPTGEMPFLDHLEELRWRIIYSLAAVFVCVGVGFFLSVRYDVVGLLAKPILPLIPEHKLVFLHPSAGFTVILNAAMSFGLVLASPVIIYQIWAFLAPALHKHERRIGLGVLFSGVFLFISGAALAYFVVVPLALPWLFGFAGPSLVPLITAEDYFSFIFAMVLTFGVSFELPIVILALAALGIVTPAFLSKYRRHAVVLIIIIGAFLTPGDLVWTTVALSVPLYMLYELSVFAARLIYRRREKKSKALEPAHESGVTA
ncbi:MAG TPA: twin-arginine translocase subunit TatC [Gemmatimonadaceae bacterium]|jgi:sec-independent protein translocase protein TatC|nr:twin-arginine translocase subunit TatC [Gemmatimonadaceae bacterium]